MTQQDRYWQAKKVTLIGALINALLGIVKVIGGFFFHSHALAADGIHSFSDLITDIMVLFASKFGSQHADLSHPYGHQRIETAATLLLSLLLILTGLGIAWDAMNELIYHLETAPGWKALPIAVLSILANEILFHYTRHVGNHIHSQLLVANAWHHRSDAASSFVVAIGLLGSLLGYIWFDALAAVIVGGLIVKMGISYGWNSVKELVDTAVDPAMLDNIKRIIQQVDGVDKIHQLRSRYMGSDILIDVHILVNPLISVSEGHYIAQHVERALITKLTHVKDVTIHVDSEDDEISSPSLHLRNRQQLRKDLFEHLEQRFPGIIEWNVHYADGRLIIDLVCEDSDGQKNNLARAIQELLPLHPDIKEIRVFSLHEIISYVPQPTKK